MSTEARPGAKQTPGAETFSERAHRLIPGGAHTYSRGDDQFPLEAPPAFARGKGGRVWDLEGREFVDWGMGINNVLVGHAEEEIDEAAITALRRGQAFSRPTPLEVEAAEAVLGLFPGMEMIKFGKNGSDANTAGIRLARAITGRDLVAYDRAAPFLAIHDWFIGTTVMKAGVPEAVRRLSVPFTFNDTASVERMFAEHPRQIAIVVLEVCRDVRPDAGFLQTLRRLCTEHGTLLLFDEIVTAFRYHLHGAQALFSVEPDLMSVGKAMANGYSLTAILGKRRWMERGGIGHEAERVFFLSTTNGPEQSALAACVATIGFYRRHDVIARLYDIGRQFMEGLEAAARRHGIGDFLAAWSDFSCRPVLRCLDREGAVSSAYRTLLVQELSRRGVFMPWICPCFRHDAAAVDRTLEALDASCEVYAHALSDGTPERYLCGPPARPVFRPFN